MRPLHIERNCKKCPFVQIALKEKEKEAMRTLLETERRQLAANRPENITDTVKLV